MRDDELVAKFEDTSLPMGCFHHEDHVRIAFLYLKQFPVLEVLERFPTALRRYAAAHGKNGLYHETITWAYIFIIRERISGTSRVVSWEEFKDENPDLFCKQAKLLEKYYKPETLASPIARSGFLMPDKSLPRGTD